MSFNRQSICLSPSKACDSVRSLGEIKLPDNSFTFENTATTNWLTKTLIHQSNYEGNLFKMNWFPLSFYNFQKQKYKWHKGIGFLASHLSSFKQTKKIFANLKTTAKLKSLFINAERSPPNPPTSWFISVFRDLWKCATGRLSDAPRIGEKHHLAKLPLRDIVHTNYLWVVRLILSLSSQSRTLKDI